MQNGSSVSDLGDVLELLFCAAERVPAMSGVYVQGTHPAAAGEARRLGAGMPVPFGALKDYPDGLLPAMREISYEVLVDGPRWRTRRLPSSASESTPGVRAEAGFDGTVRWRTGRPGEPPPSISPLARLLDPTWALRNRSLSIGSTSTVLDRPAVTVTAETRTVGRLSGVRARAVGVPTATLVVDTEFGFLLSYEQSRDGRPVQTERFVSLRLGDPAATAATYRAPLGAALSDDTQDTWAKIPGWHRRLATAGPLALGAWRVLLGRPMVPVPETLRPDTPPKMRRS